MFPSKLTWKSTSKHQFMDLPGFWEFLEKLSSELSDFPLPRWAVQKVPSPELPCGIYTVLPLLHEVTEFKLLLSEVVSTNYGGKFYWASIQDQVGLSFSLFSYWKINSLSWIYINSFSHVPSFCDFILEVIIPVLVHNGMIIPTFYFWKAHSWVIWLKIIGSM